MPGRPCPWWIARPAKSGKRGYSSPTCALQLQLHIAIPKSCGQPDEEEGPGDRAEEAGREGLAKGTVELHVHELHEGVDYGSEDVCEECVLTGEGEELGS